MDLRRCLQGHLHECRFIPLTAITSLITPERVRETLISRGLSIETYPIDHIVSVAPRVFAILVLAEGVHHIKDFIDKGLSDDSLPMDEAVIPDFETKDGKLHFIRIQRKFPPLFEKPKHLELPDDTVLPFLEQTYVDNGSFGMVYKIKVAEGYLPESTSNIVALKQILKEDSEPWVQIMREVETLRRREHPNIIPLLASFTLYGVESGFEKKSLNLIFQYAEMNMETWMNLDHTPQYLQSKDNEALRKYLYNSMYQLVSALSFLHRELDGMITAHHDLKPKNILLLGDTLKICDLGRSQLIPAVQGSATDGPKGTFTYQPPEYFNVDGSRASRHHGRSFDVWSLGCILTEMATLVVHGWRQQVRLYREQRMKSPQQRQFGKRINGNLEDDSFHNHMNEVHRWIQQLKDADGSRMLNGCLDIAQGMLNPEPEDRLYSWEAELDLFELLHPDNPRVVRLEKGALCVQPPGLDASLGAQTPFHRAKFRGDWDRLKQLLRVGWPAGVDDSAELSPLAAKSRGRDSQKDQMLVVDEENKKCHVVSRSHDTLEHSCVDELSEFIKAIKRKSSSEALGVLTRSKSLQEILRQEDEDQLTALHWAAIFDSYPTIEYILRHLEDQNMLDAKDSFGKTALHHASERSSEQVMQLMLKAYPQEDKQDWILMKDSNGKLPLHWAAQGGNTSAAKMLLQSTFNQDATLLAEDDRGNTPLLLAIKHDRSEVEVLLRGWRK